MVRALHTILVIMWTGRAENGVWTEHLSVVAEKNAHGIFATSIRQVANQNLADACETHETQGEVWCVGHTEGVAGGSGMWRQLQPPLPSRDESYVPEEDGGEERERQASPD